MKERPILFSSPMVRAILDGRKTQTRRVVNPQPQVEGRIFRWAGPRPKAKVSTGAVFINDPSMEHENPIISAFCPFGKPGDRLWVREAWREIPGGAVYDASGCVADCMEDTIHYRADTDKPSFWIWRPSIHMPRWASRITLEITGVRVERLQDISEKDAKAEGVLKQRLDDLEPPTHWRGFKGVWESINGAGSWDGNPWVWVVEFRRLP